MHLLIVIETHNYHFEFIVLAYFSYVLRHFFSYIPRDSYYVLVTVGCPFFFYSVQDSYDLYAKQ